jgi:hypothetical protein
MYICICIYIYIYIYAHYPRVAAYLMPRAAAAACGVCDERKSVKAYGSWGRSLFP